MSISESLDRPRAEVRQSVMGSLLYFEASPGRPFVSFPHASSGLSETNANYQSREVAIQNARPIAESLSLDVQGFELLNHFSAVTDFSDEEQIKFIGHAEAATLVRRATGASSVIVFDHTVRRRAPDAARQPSTRVHNDYTAASAPNRVRDLMGERAEDLLRRRVSFINVWRPIHHPASDWPLAICDARSVAAEQLIPTDIIYPGRRGEIYGLAYASQHRWSYFPRMRLDEALLLKCYDSREDVARFTPHTAFDDPTTPPSAPPRESIEFRTIAFF